MKLRSGKVLKELPPKLSTLDKLDIKLDAMLNGIKEVTSENPKHARELLDVISEATTGNCRFNIRRKIEEVYNDNNDPVKNELQGRAGRLFGLIIFEYPQYHDFIEDRIKNFNLESPLIGNIEE